MRDHAHSFRQVKEYMGNFLNRLITVDVLDTMRPRITRNVYVNGPLRYFRIFLCSSPMYRYENKRIIP